MRNNQALIIAAIGGFIVWYFWNQRRATGGNVPQRAAVPQSWIEQTPTGYTVPGTTTRPYDILT